VIQPFSYRNPRLAARYPIEFVTSDATLLGQTRDISERGLSADFGEPLLLQTAGKVRFRMGHCFLELRAEVAHSEGFMARLVFSFASPQERWFMKALLHGLTQALEGPVKKRPDATQFS
jgi:hypothetical protein